MAITNQMIIANAQEELYRAGKLKLTGRTFRVRDLLTDEVREIPEIEDIHTYKMWQSLGYQVRKGETAITKLAMLRKSKRKPPDGKQNRKEHDTMTREFRVDSTDLEAWIMKNHADYTGEYVEGVLLDNFILSTPYGFAAFYEEYVNCWTSRYRVEYVTGDDQWISGEADALWARFMEFAAKSENAA